MQSKWKQMPHKSQHKLGFRVYPVVPRSLRGAWLEVEHSVELLCRYRGSRERCVGIDTWGNTVVLSQCWGMCMWESEGRGVGSLECRSQPPISQAIKERQANNSPRPSHGIFCTHTNTLSLSLVQGHSINIYEVENVLTVHFQRRRKSFPNWISGCIKWKNI